MVMELELLEARVTQDPGQDPLGEMVATLTQTTMEDQLEQAALGRSQRQAMLALVQIQVTAVEQDLETAPRSLAREVRAKSQFLIQSLLYISS